MEAFTRKTTQSDGQVSEADAAAHGFFRGSSDSDRGSELGAMARKASSTDLSRSEPPSSFSTAATPYGASPTSVATYLSDPVLLQKQLVMEGGVDLSHVQTKLAASTLSQPVSISSYQRISSNSFNGASSPTGFISSAGNSPPPHLTAGLLDFPVLGGGGVLSSSGTLGEAGGGSSMAAMAAAAYAAEALAMRGSSPPLPSQQQQVPRSQAQGQTIAVTSDTDAYKAAGMVSFLLSQQQQQQQQQQPSGNGGASPPHCILKLQHDPSASPEVQVSQTAIAAQIALKAAQVAHRTLSIRPPFSGDVAMVPFLSSDGSVSLLVIATCLPAAVWQAQGQVSN